VPEPNSGFVAVACGAEYSVGLKSDGSIVAWGSIGMGGCDDPAPNAGYVAVAANNWFPYALKSDVGIVDCEGDVDGNGSVEVTDFLLLLSAWGPNPGHPADFDGDGVVGVTDLLIVLGNWGLCPGT
jgi:hypothetical protein